MAEKLKGPNLTINQLFDRNHQSILLGELVHGWRRGAGEQGYVQGCTLLLVKNIATVWKIHVSEGLPLSNEQIKCQIQ